MNLGTSTPTTNRLVILLLIPLLGYWSLQLLLPNDQGYSWIYLDHLNVLIHEAGHLLSLPLSPTLYLLGGSIWQCLIPATFVAYFTYRREWPGIGFSLFWLGSNLVSVGYYMADARLMALPLLGGDNATHDWHQLLTEWHLLHLAEPIGHWLRHAGLTICLLSLGLMLVLAYLEFAPSWRHGAKG